MLESAHERKGEKEDVRGKEDRQREQRRRGVRVWRGGPHARFLNDSVTPLVLLWCTCTGLNTSSFARSSASDGGHLDNRPDESEL